MYKFLLNCHFFGNCYLTVIFFFNCCLDSFLVQSDIEYGVNQSYTPRDVNGNSCHVQIVT
jgi:hypothetical protein